MSDEEEIVQDVLDQFSVQCQHIGGNTCFVPTEAVRKFVDVCNQQGLVLAHGDVIPPDEGKYPVLAMVEEDVLAALKGLAAGSGKSVTELASACIASVLTNGDVVQKIASTMATNDPMRGIPAPGETIDDVDPLPGLDGAYIPATEQVDPPEPWAFKMDYGETAEQSDDFEYETLPPKPLAPDGIPGLNAASMLGIQLGDGDNEDESGSSGALSQLTSVIEGLHVAKQDSLYLAIGFKEEDQIDLSIKYPSQGFDIHEEYEGPLHESLQEITGRLQKWGKVAFNPKLEEGESASAKLAIQIVRFDDTKGKYEAKVGGTTVWLDPEDVNAE